MEGNSGYVPNELIDKYKQQESQISDQETQLNMMLSKISDLEEENANLTKTLEESKGQNNNASIKDTSKLEALQTENDTLLSENSNLKEELLKLQMEYMQINDKLSAKSGR